MNFLGVFVLVLSSVSAQTPCEFPNVTDASCVCNGVKYDFGSVLPSDGNQYFQVNEDNKWTYYFQMTKGGLPSNNGVLAHCDLDGVSGYAAAQGRLANSECYPLGKIGQQVWMIDEKKNPQEITVQFAGGENGRMFYNTFVCDLNAKINNFTFIDETPFGVYHAKITTSAACPPQTPKYYRCINNVCVENAHGTNETICNRVCGNPVAKYKCENNQCVLTANGTSLNTCRQICGPRT
eukprot:m.240446 g.240446  ORF g.240446 m.240446 type:complete len:237 (-) comp16081_c0_seq3:1378-2088(-)